MKKSLSVILFLLVALIFATSATNVDATYSIDRVEVNGVDMTPVGVPLTSPILKVDRGDSVGIRVEFRSDVSANDVRVRAWIEGYEYSDIEDSTELFDMNNAGVTNVKNLVLKIPEDVDASEEYTLHVKVSDKLAAGDDEEVYTLRIAKQRRNLNFVDVIFNPGLNVRSDQPLFITVRVENLGDKDENDVRVIAAIPELGLSQRTFLDDLRATDPNDASQEDSSESTESLYLDLSEVKPGNYNVLVRVEYNRGHDYIERLYPLTVTSGKTPVQVTEELIVDVVEKVKDVEAGEGVVYKVSLANLGSEARTLTLEVAGAEAFGTARADPSTLTVEADSSREAFVFVSAKEDADSGNKLFSVRVKEGNTVVKEVQLQANVDGQEVATTSSFRSGLEVGFIVLLVVLVILGIILAVNKLRGKEEPEQTYY
ncbi:hypothetical protein J4213_04330 [Candidatus Woesearchaeota archaeon]|nr:hypothetical protein [Candidatus Woesearchaeota archaeon]